MTIIDEFRSPDGERRIGFDEKFFYVIGTSGRWKKWRELSWTEKRLIKFLGEGRE